MTLYKKSPQAAATVVLAFLDSGEWALHRAPPVDHLTDEANTQDAWWVQRNVAPFATAKNVRIWTGPTAYDALVAAHAALFEDSKPLPGLEHLKNGQVHFTQCTVRLTVGAAPVDNADTLARDLLENRHARAFLELERRLNFEWRDLFSPGDLELEDSITPFSLCNFEYDLEVAEGKASYSVTIHKDGDCPDGVFPKLHALVLEAYGTYCYEPASVSVTVEQKFSFVYSQKLPLVA